MFRIKVLSPSQGCRYAPPQLIRVTGCRLGFGTRAPVILNETTLRVHSVCIPLNRCPPPSDRVHITIVRGAGGPPPWHSRLSIYGRTRIGEAIWRPNQRVAPPGGDGPKYDGPASARLQQRR